MTSSCFEAREKKDEEEEDPDEDVDEDRDVNFPNQEWSGGLKYSVKNHKTKVKTENLTLINKKIVLFMYFKVFLIN